MLRRRPSPFKASGMPAAYKSVLLLIEKELQRSCDSSPHWQVAAFPNTLHMNRPRRILVNVSTLVVLLVAPSAARAQQIDHAQAATPLRQLPIRFEPTAQKRVLVARGIGAAIRLSSRSIDFPLRRNGEPHDSIRVRFDGARRSSRVIGVDPLPGRVNYLYGDRACWRSNVPTYARARTPNLYRGIDVDYYGAGDQLETT